MHKIGTLAFLGLGLVLGLRAQNVAEDVLKSIDLSGVKFIDYVGPVAVVESRAAIIGIGEDLGGRRKAEPVGPIPGEKYSLLRVRDPQSALLGADVLVLGDGAGVDTIRNLNWIVAGYLEKAFGYTFDEALLLADFVTRYNAVYRGNLDYFQKSYVPALSQNLSKENAGLALSYRDWPGRTRIVIPLRDTLSKGPAGSVNAEEISNPAVTGAMKNQPALEERKKLADLKEGEIVQEQKTISQKEQSLAQQEGSVAPVPPTSTAGAGASSPSATPTSPAKTQTAAAGTATQAAPPSNLDQQKQEIAQAKAANDKRDQQLQQERQDIQKEDKKLQATETPQPAAPPPPTTTPFLQILDANGLGRLLLVDTSGNRTWKASTVNSIRRGVFQSFGGGLLVTAGEQRGNATVRLMILSLKDLTSSAVSAEDVSADAPVVISGASAYAVVKDKAGRWVVGEYDAGLKTKQLSPEEVRPNSGLVVTPQAVLVQGPNGEVLILDPTNLAKVGVSKDLP